MPLGRSLLLPVDTAILVPTLQAKVVVVGLGISGFLPSAPIEKTAGDPYYEFETHDRQKISLPPVQIALLLKILALNKPTVIFLLNGGAVSIPPAVLTSHAAVVEAFYPGMEGAAALTQLLFGLENRWGKLPLCNLPPPVLHAI
jgi:beta-glucosidase